MAHRANASTLAAAAVRLALVLGAGGCCTHVPRVTSYFDRGDPLTAVNGFVYAVEVGDWEFAYQSITEESKKLITATKFKWALRFNVEVPEIKAGIRDLITHADRKRFRLKRSSRDAEWVVPYRHPGGDILRLKIFIVKETMDQARAAGRDEEIWLIDFDATLRNLGASLPAGGETAP
jgi:hypothetical protein